MMLSEIFDHLGHGELSQLVFAGTGEAYSLDAGIREEDRPKVIGHIQLALTALYKRFRLSSKEVRLTLVPGRASYVLARDYVVGNAASAEPVRYLTDTAVEPFDDTILKIDDVRAVLPDRVAGSHFTAHPSLALNIPGDPLSIRTPTATSLALPGDLVSALSDRGITELEVHYRASHPRIDIALAAAAPFQVQIQLPATHLQALLYYVASRIMNPIGMTDEFHAGNSYYAKYEAECARLEHENMQIDHVGEEDRFHARGFV